MINSSYHQACESVFGYVWQLQFVLSGFAQHLASHFASYSANPGSLVEMSGLV